MTESLFEATGLSISVFNPHIVAGASYTPRGDLVDDSLADRLVSTGLLLESQADGGWWSASLSLTLGPRQLDWWFEEGLNKHLEVYDPSGAVVWAGFCNLVSIQNGPLSVQRGPLMDVANRVSVVYTPILDPDTAPPIEGSETTTTIADDATSQDNYGILEAVVAGGKLLDDGTTDDAVLLRDAYIAENRDPQSGQELSLPATATATCTLEFLGYVHRFSKQVYQDTTVATVQVDTQIQNVIAADPNVLFSLDFSKIEANPTLASRFDDDNRDAWAVLTELVALGDGTGIRCTLGVYEEQQIIYSSLPTAYAYQHAIAESTQTITYYGTGQVVDPWSIRPAQWLYLVDFLPQRDDAATIRADPRSIFVENVSYSAPFGVSIMGTKISRFTQLLEQLSS